MLKKDNFSLYIVYRKEIIQLLKDLKKDRFLIDPNKSKVKSLLYIIGES